MRLMLRVRLRSALVAFFRTTRVLLRMPMPFNISALTNLGVTLFLLMADSCSRSKLSTQSCNNKSPFSYKFRNMLATSNFCIIPLTKTFITSVVLSSLYLLLLSIQRPARDFDMALAVTGLACSLQGLLPVAALFGFEACSWAQCTNVYENVPLGSDFWRAIDKGSRLVCSSGSSAAGCFFFCWWLTIFVIFVCYLTWFLVWMFLYLNSCVSCWWSTRRLVHPNYHIVYMKLCSTASNRFN